MAKIFDKAQTDPQVNDVSRSVELYYAVIYLQKYKSYIRETPD